MPRLTSNIVYAEDYGETIDLQDNIYQSINTATGGLGNDIIRGNSLENDLSGGFGDDQIWGGVGSSSDTLLGGAGSNGLWWGKYEGTDTFVSSSKSDALWFYNTSFKEVTALFSNSDLVFQSDNNNKVILSGWQNAAATDRMQSFIVNDNGICKAYAWNNGSSVEVDLSDGAYMNYVNYLECIDSSNAVLRGSSGNDYIKGGVGNDQIWGGAGGADTLVGGDGADTFWFGNGNGNDVIASASADSKVKLYNVTNAAISRSNNDLLIRTFSGDTLTITDWYDGKSVKINQFEFADGTIKKVGNYGWQTIGANENGFNIEVDYSRYDSAGFFTNHPERQAVLEEACQVWEGIIADDFENILAGTKIQVVNPNTSAIETVTLGSDIDDLRIYMGSTFMTETRTLAVATPFTSSNTGNAILDNRYNDSTTFQPWIGSITVNSSYANMLYADPTPEDPYDDYVSSDKYDLLDIIVHEMGHILGFGAGNAGNQYVVNIGGVPYFTGPHAEQVYGGPVPLDFNSGVHVAQSSRILSTMEPSLDSGTRVLPTALDKAILADMGYHIS